MKAIYTIGHSNRSLEEFIQLLRANGITKVVDVRTTPRSRSNPQFDKETLPESLKEQGIGYEHMDGLGGRRPKTKGSVNTAWEVQAFRNYADYMQTPEFQQNLDRLVKAMEQDRIAIMCSEAVPWRCHRRLIGDALLVKGIEVLDIVSTTKVAPHALTPWAEVDGGRITYPKKETASDQPLN